jgi:cobalt/nickel transport protein
LTRDPGRRPFGVFLPTDDKGGRTVTRKWFSTLFVPMLLALAAPAAAHFGMVIPARAMVMQGDVRTLEVTLSFSHPMEMVGMPMAQPRQFKVMTGETHEDLRDQLQPVKVLGQEAWWAAYTLRRPGVYTFYMEPEPYWEPTEDRFIVHITKTVVAAFGDEEGWDAEVGLKTEIVPLARPFGLYAGNLFQGIVKMDGRPVPFAEVEVEHYNVGRKARILNDYMVTQVARADGNGVFSFAVPWAGWWGFAALNAADYKIGRDGEDKDVELGAVLWVHFEALPTGP